MTLIALFEIQWSDYSSDLVSALLKTIEFTVAGFAGAALLGLILALMRLSPPRAAAHPRRRSTPSCSRTSRCSRSSS